MSLYKNKKVFTEKEIEKLQDCNVKTIPQDYAQITGLMGNETLEELVRKYAVVPLGGEEVFDVISKYGHSFLGICDGFKWDNLDSVTELDAYKLIALCSIYWERQYRLWYRKSQEEICELKKQIKEFTK